MRVYSVITAGLVVSAFLLSARHPVATSAQESDTRPVPRGQLILAAAATGVYALDTRAMRLSVELEGVTRFAVDSGGRDHAPVRLKSDVDGYDE